MGIKDLISSRLKSKSTTHGIYLGSPEAEAEATGSSRIPLYEVYEDYHGLINSITHEKFIILGRKGSGKSAFAEYINEFSKNDANTFCGFIKKTEINLEKIVQIGSDTGINFDKSSLFKWLILTNILKLFSENKVIENNKNFNLLKQFLDKNSGYINIKGTDIKELIETKGFDINIEYLKRFFRTKLNRKLEIRSEKAPFYKLIPDLESVVESVLTSEEERNNDNQYFLFFDDLDIDVSSKDKASIDSIVELLRVAKYINNELFGKNNLKSKVIILLRDDISQVISHYADTAKIISSYATSIDWYQDRQMKHGNELNINLRKFINKRIAVAFAKAGTEYNTDDPWLSLMTENGEGKTQFKYIIDHTLYRPRDLLLIFKVFENYEYELPIKHYETKDLLKMFASEFIQEIKNELSFHYSTNQIGMIFNFLEDLYRKQPSTYDEAINLVKNNCTDLSEAELLKRLFYYSVIGSHNEGYVQFKFRNPNVSFDKEKKIILHNTFPFYFDNVY